MTWEIVAGLITLAGFIITICKVVANNTQALTEVSIALQDLKEDTEETKNNVREIEKTVSNHEARISVIEHDK